MGNHDASSKDIALEQKRKAEQTMAAKAEHYQKIVLAQKKKIQDLEVKISLYLKRIVLLENNQEPDDSDVQLLKSTISRQELQIQRLEQEIVFLKGEDVPEITDPKRKQLYNYLKDKRSFQQMSDRMLRILVNNLTTQRLTKGEIIIQEDTVSSHVFLILKGKIAVVKNGVEIYEMQRIGDIFGEISMLTQAPASASIIAKENLELMNISHEILSKIGDKDFYLWLGRILSDKLQRTTLELTGVKKIHSQKEQDIILDTISMLNAIDTLAKQQIEHDSQEIVPEPVQEDFEQKDRLLAAVSKMLKDMASIREEDCFSIETYEEDAEQGHMLTEIVLNNLKQDHQVITVRKFPC
ncbi:MAG: cyclic nucleotide-binding domain-containing protein [SAR324 cluster bacterium]|nr:cyclic nucleotide-binding domain-containing protein [SAR324 cluster bacterium]